MWVTCERVIPPFMLRSMRALTGSPAAFSMSPCAPFPVPQASLAWGSRSMHYEMKPSIVESDAACHSATWSRTMQTAWHDTWSAQCSTALHNLQCTMKIGVAWHGMAQQSVVQHSMAQHGVAPNSTA